ncbi:esterase/lipase family protein [Nocardia sp. FDAARGOS_372]|uniref:esterase/lipase family protein n=1 Tax=Nocardia sp. FDAARGOS_372 TaxID=2018066 RepID=UPI000BF1E74B|nr:alpha/beta fold hydrolase [Nocardia sp. FDAARGOS_372]PEH79411.1 lipase [Nocardia sp. FDAARGOS_372]
MRWLSPAVPLVAAASILGATAVAAADGPLADHRACVPAAAHPDPVVLLHGTTDSTQALAALAARLTAAGHCVYALDYGKDPATGGLINGYAPIERSVGETRDFVTLVLDRTGAARVDLVGHSQGGVIALALAKEPTLVDRIDTEVLLAPATHGTTLDGAVDLSNGTGARPAVDGILAAGVCPVCRDLQAGSPFIQRLATPSVTVPGIRYAVLATRDDLVVTPAGQASFIDEPAVANVFLQDLAPNRYVEHARLPQDSVVIDWVADTLADAAATNDRHGAGPA